MKICPECNTEYNEFPERKIQYQKKYCSRRCANICSNREHPKRIAHATITCLDCSKTFLKKNQKGRKVCPECRVKRNDNFLYKLNPTRKEVVYKELTRAAAFAYIRWHAKVIVMKDVKKECAECGYTNHVETCHIKAIASFTDDDRLNDINHPNNLLFLCPNHHWEHDFKKSAPGEIRTLDPKLKRLVL